MTVTQFGTYGMTDARSRFHVPSPGLHGYLAEDIRGGWERVQEHHRKRATRWPMSQPRPSGSTALRRSTRRGDGPRSGPGSQILGPWPSRPPEGPGGR